MPSAPHEEHADVRSVIFASSLQAWTTPSARREVHAQVHPAGLTFLVTLHSGTKRLYTSAWKILVNIVQTSRRELVETWL